MNKFNKELAPITSKAWEAISNEAKNALSLKLSGRKVADFTGPLGWEKSSVETGEVKDLAKEAEVSVKQRQVLPLIELSVPFKVSRKDLELIERGGVPALDTVIDAAHKIAKAEENIVYSGLTSAKIKGILSDASLSVKLESDEKYPETVAGAISKLNEKAISGPFALVLGSKEFNHLMTATHKNGRPIVEHISKLVDNIIKAPFLDGAFLLSKRGGDFEFVSGQDISIGYTSHDDKYVNLYLEESLTFKVTTPDAVVIFK
ncbi:MAG: family 1 encapsulin nanocompartment shell protein [Alphaproteobacteria bacterium]